MLLRMAAAVCCGGAGLQGGSKGSIISSAAITSCQAAERGLCVPMWVFFQGKEGNEKSMSTSLIGKYKIGKGKVFPGAEERG